MRVDSLNKIKSSINKIKPKNRGGPVGAFTLTLDTDEDKVESICAAPKINYLNPFLSLQEIDDSISEHDEKATLLNEGGALIDHLKEIMLGLINGSLKENNIRKLKETIEQKKYKFFTKEAQDLYDEIYLRARVELAKLERSANNK